MSFLIRIAVHSLLWLTISTYLFFTTPTYAEDLSQYVNVLSVSGCSAVEYTVAYRAVVWAPQAAETDFQVSLLVEPFLIQLSLDLRLICRSSFCHGKT
jgi:hypothetical protein